jgi:hypothetical protein
MARSEGVSDDGRLFGKAKEYLFSWKNVKMKHVLSSLVGLTEKNNHIARRTGFNCEKLQEALIFGRSLYWLTYTICAVLVSIMRKSIHHLQAVSACADSLRHLAIPRMTTGSISF